MASRSKKRSAKAAPRSRKVGFKDLPAEAILRIAAKLEITPHILNLRGCCSHARACLDSKGWASLIKRRFGEFSTPGLPDARPQKKRARAASGNKPESAPAEEQRRHLELVRGEYDTRNNPKLSEDDFKQCDGNRPGKRILDLRGRFKAVTPGIYDLSAGIPWSSSSIYFTQRCFTKIHLTHDGYTDTFSHWLYSGGLNAKHFNSRADYDDYYSMLCCRAVKVDAPCDIKIRITDCSTDVSESVGLPFDVRLVKREAAWPSLPAEKRRRLRRDGKPCIGCDHPQPSGAEGWDANSDVEYDWDAARFCGESESESESYDSYDRSESEDW